MHQYSNRGLCLLLSASQPGRHGAYFVWCLILQPSSSLSSVPGESLAAAGDGSLSSVSEPMSIEGSGEMGLISVKDTEPDPAAYIVSEVAKKHLYLQCDNMYVFVTHFLFLTHTRIQSWRMQWILMVE